MTRLQEIKLESLNDGPGLLPFKLGSMKLTTHLHTFIQYVKLDDIETNIHSLETQLLDCRNRMSNITYNLYEIQINYLANKLGNIVKQLHSLEPSRVKRGLMDGLGSMIKSLTGNLDHDDALKYNEAIKVLDLELREYYNIIKPGSYFVNKQIVFIFKFPIFSKETYDFYKLSVVPNKYNHALIPPFPFLATIETSFVYMEAECPKLTNWYLCEKEFDHQIRTKSDCIQELITNQVIQETSEFTTVTLTKAAMEKLDDQHYALSFPQQTKVQLSCNQKDYTSLQGSYLATIPSECRLKSEQFTISNDYNEIKGQPLKLMKIPYHAEKQSNKVPHIHLKSIDLQGLHNIQDQLMMIQTPIQLYSILLSAGVLGVLVATRRYLWKCNKDVKKEQQPSNEILQASGNPENIPATFSLNVLK